VYFWDTLINEEIMMRKTLFVILGVVVLLVALFLDNFGLPTKEGFGLVQIAGMAVGAALILVGLIGKWKKKAE
jgi:hypothetical protein